MRRVLSLLVLGAFVAGPGLGAKCFLSCARIDRAAPTHCHDDSASGPALTGDASCPAAIPTATTGAKRADAVSSAPAGVLMDVTPNLAARGSLSTHHTFDRTHGPPLATFLVPLRI